MRQPTGMITTNTGWRRWKDCWPRKDWLSNPMSIRWRRPGSARPTPRRTASRSCWRTIPARPDKAWWLGTCLNVHFTFQFDPDSLALARKIDRGDGSLVFPLRIRSLALMEFSPQQDEALQAVAR